MLILSEKDIQSCTTPKLLIAAIEKAMLLYEQGDFHMPNRMHIDHKDNTLLLMPCFKPGSFSTKLVSVFPENRKLGKPAIYGSMILNDGETGEAKALMHGGKLTAVRTAAVGSIGVRYLSDSNASKLGVVGMGVQGYHQVLFACAERPVKKIYMLDPYANREQLLDKLQKELPNVSFYFVDSSEELLANSEIVICATTSETPVLANTSELLKGKTIIGVGSYKPSMQEFPDELFKHCDKVFIDTEHAKEETGDLKNPLGKGLLKDEQVFTIGKLLNKEESKREVATQVFKSVGMALFDLFIAEELYKLAKQEGIGTEIEF